MATIRESFRSKAQQVIVHPFCEVFILGDTKAIGFAGRRVKADFYYSFTSPAKMQEYVNNFVNRHAKAYNEKQERRAKDKAVKAADFFQVGDVLVSSWGYEQTNIDFYQVTGLTGKSVRIRQLKKMINEPDYTMSGTCAPLVGEFKDGEPELLKRVSGSGYVNISSFAIAKLADRTELTAGVYVYKAVGFTSYA